MTASGANLSVVVVSFSEPNTLAKCLESLSNQNCAAEIIIVRDSQRNADEIKNLRARFKQWLWLDAPAKSTVPRMRMLGIDKASKDVIALIEDDCAVSPTWASDLMAAHQSTDCPAIGGPVQPADFKHALSWAVFFCEYARFMPPFQGAVAALPGNNMSYKSSALKELSSAGALADGFYEVFVNSALQKNGHQLQAAPAVAVCNGQDWNMTNLTNTPYNHGRAFAGARFAGQTSWARIPYLGVSLLLPALQTLRVCRQVATRKEHVPQLFPALPYITLFWISWSIGEFMGYLLGSGRSLDEWR
jgi:hypothetical protein